MSGEQAIVRQLVTFGRCLREAGLEVGPGRLDDALTGLTHVDVTRPDDVYWTLRATLVTRVEEIEPFDRAFRAWFLRRPTQADGRAAPPPPTRRVLEQHTRADGSSREEAGDPSEIGWSAHEVLREKDFAAMTPEELVRLRALLEQVAARRPLRRSRRLRPHHRGRVVDLRRIARLSLATGGDPLERAFRRRAEAPRKLEHVRGSRDSDAIGTVAGVAHHQGRSDNLDDRVRQRPLRAAHRHPGQVSCGLVFGQ